MRIGTNAALLGFAMTLFVTGCTHYPGLIPLVAFEQRHLDIREPEQIPHNPAPEFPPPETVSARIPPGPAKELTLDEAIRIALANAKVIRTLAGVDVVSTGKTIYDPAVSNTN